MNDEKKKPDVLPEPEGLVDEPTIAEMLRIWMTPEGKIYGSWADILDGGKSGLGGLLGSIAQMIVVTTDKEEAAERLRVVTRDFLSAAARVPDKMPEVFPELFSYNKIVGAFHEEKDRSAGILAAAWLDSYLGQCLRYFLVHDLDESAKFVGSEQELEKPLSSFGVRARALYLLGLISKEAFADLKRISRIRNRFAHHPDVLDFEDAKIKGECGNLRTAQLQTGQNAREWYLFAVSMLVSDLNNTLLLTHPREAVLLTSF